MPCRRRRKLRQDRADRRHLAEAPATRQGHPRHQGNRAGALAVVDPRRSDRLRCEQPDGGAGRFAAAAADGLRRSLPAALAGAQPADVRAVAVRAGEGARRHRSPRDAGGAGGLRQGGQGAACRRFERAPVGRDALHAAGGGARLHASSRRRTPTTCSTGPYETGLAEVCHREQVGLLAYSPLGFGSYPVSISTIPPHPGA